MDHTNTCPQNYKFTGYERDAETGLDYAFFRYYNSRLGRFMSPDPLGGSVSNPQSLNRYAYVLNNPANAIDPVGLACQDPFDPICIADTDPGGGGGGGYLSCEDLQGNTVPCNENPDPNPMLCGVASSNCDPFGLLGPVSRTIGGFRAGDGGFFGGGPQCTVNGGFVACSLAYWLDRVNDDLGCHSKEGCFPPIGPPKQDPEQSPKSQQTQQSPGKPVPCEDQACELARAMNKTGVQALQNPCTALAFYAGSAAGATGASVASDGAVFPEITDAVVNLAIRYHLSPRPVQWLARQVGYAAVWLGSKVQSGCNALQP